jgi:hypothetical protein
MPEELTLKIKELTDAVNAANDAFRAALARYGIKTAEDYFSLIENKPMLQRLFAAAEDDLNSFAVLALSPCEVVH